MLSCDHEKKEHCVERGANLATMTEPAILHAFLTTPHNTASQAATSGSRADFAGCDAHPEPILCQPAKRMPENEQTPPVSVKARLARVRERHGVAGTAFSIFSPGHCAASLGNAWRFASITSFPNPLPQHHCLAAGRGSRIIVQRAGEDHELVKHFPRPPAIIRPRFAAGAQCLIALKEAESDRSLSASSGFSVVVTGKTKFVPLYSPAANAYCLGLWTFMCKPRSAARLRFARLWDEAPPVSEQRGNQMVRESDFRI